MKLPCATVRDLLSLYVEDLVEAETRSLVEEHLSACEDCRSRLLALRTESQVPVDAAKPLIGLKKQIRKRRLFTAVIAALCVFVVLFTYFYHADSMRLVPWEEGLIEVKGIESVASQEVFGASEGREETVDVLILDMDSKINGIHENASNDEYGTTTVILQGWSRKSFASNHVSEYSGMILYPIPDRVIYDDGTQSTLLWGEPLDGGVEILPRLVLGNYALIAEALAVVLGMLWLVLRKRKIGGVLRQLFFAPVSYLIAQLLIKGVQTSSFFIEHDFFSILLMMAALYVLISLTWQLVLQRQFRQVG